MSSSAKPGKGKASVPVVAARRYFRLPAAAQLLGLEPDDLLYMAARDETRVCVLGGGRLFQVIDFVETAPGEWTARRRSDGPLAVSETLAVPAGFVVPIEAGRASMPAYFDGFERPAPMFIPATPFEIGTDELFVRTSEIEALQQKARTPSQTGVAGRGAWSDLEKGRMRAMRKSGQTDTAIAARFGCKRQRVAQLIGSKTAERLAKAAEKSKG